MTFFRAMAVLCSAVSIAAVPVTVTVLAAAGGLSAHAGENGVQPAAQDQAGEEKGDKDPRFSAHEAASRAARLDSLFSRLKDAKTAEKAERIELSIWKVWNESGSASIDFLMDRGIKAMASGQQGDALIYFTQVVTLAPGYAEGWSKRATLYYLMDDYQRALKDVEQTLRLEPRHFGALGGLAVLLNELGDKEGALSAYRRVLKIHPYLEGAQAAEKALSEEVEGQGI